MAAAIFESILPSIFPFPIPSALRELSSRALGITELEAIYQVLQAMDRDLPIADRLIQHLGVQCDISAVDLQHIPAAGPAIVTVNHPFGILEGAVLASLLAKIRTDVRFLANGLLTRVPEIRDLIIAVDPMSGSSAATENSSGVRKALEHLRSGGMLVIFPAGEVSHFRWSERAITDGKWNPIVARLVAMAARKACHVTVVPAYVEGANSTLFQVAGMAHAALRTALLGRELLNKRGRRLEIRVGKPVAADKLMAIPGAREQAEYLRWRTYLLARRQRFQPRTSLPVGVRRHAAQIEAPVDREALAADIAQLPGDCLLQRSGDLEVYLAGASQLPNVLREIGRLREVTFRAVEEGTGKGLDLDEFDQEYLHLFVWHAGKQEVVGAYRLARTTAVRSLYSASLFGYGDEFLQRLGPAIELGRSFVRQEYQKGFAPLLLLWKGIGMYVARHPECKCLFGAVSISNRYQSISRELMVSFLERYAMLREWSGLLRDRKAFARRLLKGVLRPVFPQTGFDIEDLSTVVSDVESDRAGVPVLLRQYLRLGGKLLGFRVDPEFANALDGLILVDLTKTEPKPLERYLGKRQAEEFLEFQKRS